MPAVADSSRAARLGASAPPPGHRPPGQIPPTRALRRRRGTHDSSVCPLRIVDQRVGYGVDADANSAIHERGTHQYRSFITKKTCGYPSHFVHMDHRGMAGLLADPPTEAVLIGQGRARHQPDRVVGGRRAGGRRTGGREPRAKGHVVGAEPVCGQIPSRMRLVGRCQGVHRLDDRLAPSLALISHIGEAKRRSAHWEGQDLPRAGLLSPWLLPPSVPSSSSTGRRPTLDSSASLPARPARRRAARSGVAAAGMGYEARRGQGSSSSESLAHAASSHTVIWLHTYGKIWRKHAPFLDASLPPSWTVLLLNVMIRG